MKLTGWGALVCAALVTIACADARNDRDDDNRSAAGTSGAYSDDDSSVLDDRDDDSRLDSEGDAQARIGESVGDDRSRLEVGTSGQVQGQMHGASGDARHFVEMASMHSNAELQLSQLATERAQNAEVKQFAQMMVRDHTKANNELKQAVSGQNAIIKTDMDQKHQQTLSRLRNLRGAEFDREYMRAMVDGHTEMRSMLQARTGQDHGDTAGTRTSGDARTHGGANPTGTTGTAAGTRAGANTQLDTSVNSWATKTLPTVEQHLQKAQQIHGKMETSATGTTGSRPGNPTGKTTGSTSEHGQHTPSGDSTKPR